MEKEYFIKINGENIPVTEEVYRAYMQPLWAESKRRKARQAREIRNLTGNGCYDE